MPWPDQEGKYTYADYLTWPEGERWEIFDGAAYLQAAPSWQHQSISGELYRQISNYFVNKHCRVFAAPFDDVRPHTRDFSRELGRQYL